jgi:Rho GTPase-activating protein 1
MHPLLARRRRGSSLSAVPPTPSSIDWSQDLADLAAHIVYLSPLPSQESDLPIYVLNAAAFPDVEEVNYDALLPYVLARFPSEEQLLGGKGYAVVFFAGGQDRGSGDGKKRRAGWSWFMKAYEILSRAMRKRLLKLYVVHERRWVRVMIETFSTVVSPKFRKKIVHCSTLSALALHMPLEDLLIPPAVYEYDRTRSRDIYVPYASGKRAFGVPNPLPIAVSGTHRLPRVLRETTSFLLLDHNLQVEGLFRVNARATTLSILQEAYDRGQKFVIWREGLLVFAASHWREGVGEVKIEDLARKEGYNVHTAAGLLKKWYNSLSQPVFPESCYPYLEEYYGNEEERSSAAPLITLLKEDSETSPLSKISRLSLTMHLFPLLSTIARHQDTNKMTPQNIATCFAPSLVCGSDPIRDAKMYTIVSNILKVGIETWTDYLAEELGMSNTKFGHLLETPKEIADKEDPLTVVGASYIKAESLIQNIALVDNDESEDDLEENRPPLPPRGSAEPVGAMLNNDIALKRKPAPLPQTPPRYSTLSIRPFHGTETAPEYALHITDGLAAHVPSDSSSTVLGHSESSGIVRKPISVVHEES